MFNILIYFISATAKPVSCVSNEQADIFISGTYVKSLCVIKVNDTQTNQYTACKNAGMKLFVTDSTEAQSTLSTTLITYYGVQKTGQVFWLDGKKDATDGKWYYHGSGVKVPFYDGLIWNITPDSASGCLITVSNRTTFVLGGRGVNLLYYAVCEYVK